ncbi:MAG: tRNA (adenosine(37)-N6)-threonylcarbamoyltransferase complex dimerization subunit type 1 TsaB [Sphingomonas sp.]
MGGTILVIETATAACSAALLRGDGVVAERHEVVGRGHAERLAPMIEALLDGIRPESVLVDCGPGSFTGLRVGLACAHGLAIGWGVPLTGYSSLALLSAMSGEAEIAAALHGGHGELFVQDFAGEPLAALGPVRSLAPQDAARTIVAQTVIGPAAALVVAERGGGRAIDVLPRAAEAPRLPPALRGLPPRPIYGRAPDARPMP